MLLSFQIFPSLYNWIIVFPNVNKKTTSEAINLFYKQIKLRKGLPFKVVIPNDLTQKTMKETDNNLNLIESETTEEMFNKLGI